MFSCSLTTFIPNRDIGYSTQLHFLTRNTTSERDEWRGCARACKRGGAFLAGGRWEDVEGLDGLGGRGHMTEEGGSGVEWSGEIDKGDRWSWL